jgi:hypothetical protein
VALLPSEADLAPVVELAVRLARRSYPGTAVLLVCDTPDGWAPRWGIEPETTEQPSDLPGNLSRFSAWRGGFELQTYPYGSPVEGPPGQETLDALLEKSQVMRITDQDLNALLQRNDSFSSELTRILYEQDRSQFIRPIETDVSA